MAARNPTTPVYPLPGKPTYGTDRNDVIVTTDRTQSVDARAGDDLIIVTNSIGKPLTVIGNLGNDTVSYEGASQGATVHLGNSDLNAGAAQGHICNSVENLIGTDWDDYFYGNAYANRLVGGGGTDYLFGGGGNDILEGGDALDYINGDEGNDIAYGGAGDDSINGNAGNDTLYGDIGNDTLRGGEGNDILIGGPGADAMYGGYATDDLGIDTVSYATSSGLVRLSLADGVGYAGEAAGDTYHGIENVVGPTGGSHVTGNDSANIIQASGSVNTFRGLGGDDTLVGADGWDILDGGADNDRVYARGGDDFIHAGPGDDHVDGGEGVDQIYYRDDLATSGVVVDLVAGTSTSTYFGTDTLIDIEDVQGSDLADTLSGDDEANRLAGNGGNDELFGREGDDWLSGGNGADTLNGGEGTDTAFYQYGGANLASGTGADGDGLIDTLIDIENLLGGGGGNELVGNNQDNVLNGQWGNDILNGRRGNDTLIGGEGEDIFVFDQNGFANDQDIVEDFEVGIDRLDFSNSSIDDLGEFQDAATQVGADVVIDTGNGSITLLNVQLSAMSFGDLIF